MLNVTYCLIASISIGPTATCSRIGRSIIADSTGNVVGSRAALLVPEVRCGIHVGSNRLTKPSSGGTRGSYASNRQIMFSVGTLRIEQKSAFAYAAGMRRASNESERPFAYMDLFRHKAAPHGAYNGNVAS